MPGVTRDRQYGEGAVGDRPYIVVDTGGIVISSDSKLEHLTDQQVEQAIAEADRILFVVDVTHTILAAVVAPMVLRTAYLGLSRRYVSHKSIARRTLPIWMYVSITGVVVYLMLYQL